VSANVETSGFVGRVLGGRWVVGEQLGSGSFGVVHAGIERGTGMAVAVKLLHPQFLHHHETIARFWNEAEALRRMNHPNVLVLLDVGVADDGVPYLVTELLTGETLRDLLNREGALPPERAMRLLGPAAHALHHAHIAGIVHRDLKPENIFRVRRDGMGTTKILDFGVAKLLDTQPGKKLSQTGIMIGTMAYSPPEQMQGIADIDHRADQFGFAALMFEALTGQRPFPQTQPFALFQAVMNGPRPRASQVKPGLTRAVDDVLMKGLDADRDRRYRNVEDFYIALTQAFTTQNFQGISTTFSGQGAPAPRPIAHSSQAVPVAAPSRMEPSTRFRPIQEEATRNAGDVAASDLSSPNIGQTLAQGGQTLASRGVASAPLATKDLPRDFQTTLVEGSKPGPSAPPPSTAPPTQPKSAPTFIEPGPPPELAPPTPDPGRMQSSAPPPMAMGMAPVHMQPSLRPQPAAASVPPAPGSAPLPMVAPAPKKSSPVLLVVAILLLLALAAAAVWFFKLRGQ
jgi:serine/threonine protein kinase